jgi:hypothetical protein
MFASLLRDFRPITRAPAYDGWSMRPTSISTRKAGGQSADKLQLSRRDGK